MVADARRQYTELTDRARKEAEQSVEAAARPTTATWPTAAPSRPGWCRRPRWCGRRTPRPPASSTTAEAEADRLRRECDAYVDGKLAEIEDTLGKALATVTRGRSQLWRGTPAGAPRRPHRHRHGPHRLATASPASAASRPSTRPTLEA